ncbi:MAG: TRAP transporter substrate-binding protein [Pseudomonadota bacterium]
MDRRSFIKKAGVAAGAGVAATSLAVSAKAASHAKKDAMAAPASATKKKEMNVVSTWPKDFPGLGTGAQRLAKRIEDLTDGTIKVNYFAAGEQVPPFGSFDHVASGKAQAYHAADYYWKGKHPGFAYYTAVPFGFIYTEMNAWINHLGGQQLWDKLGGEFGVKCFAAGNTGVQMGGWFRKEINSADDLKGLKMRIPGLGGDVMAKLGASPVSLPGGQIYENLTSGAIDATEWVGPWNDYAMKFYEAAKFYYYPGMHEPASQLAFGMNASFWGSLSKNEQIMIQAACAEETLNSMSEYNAKNGEFLAKLRNDHGVKLRRFNEDIYDSFGKAANEVFETTRQHSKLAGEIHESFLKARQDVGAWMNLSDGPYLAERNRVLGVE